MLHNISDRGSVYFLHSCPLGDFRTAALPFIPRRANSIENVLLLEQRDEPTGTAFSLHPALGRSLDSDARLHGHILHFAFRSFAVALLVVEVSIKAEKEASHPLQTRHNARSARNPEDGPHVH